MSHKIPFFLHFYLKYVYDNKNNKGNKYNQLPNQIKFSNIEKKIYKELKWWKDKHARNAYYRELT